jgi:hypothetical protein
MNNILRKTLTLSLVLSFALAGCAGREAKPVAFSQSGDLNLSCSQLRSQVDLNSEQIRRLVGENKQRVAKNVVATAGALIFLPSLLFIDAKGAEREELEALANRNKHLANIAKKKGCPIPEAKLK